MRSNLLKTCFLAVTRFAEHGILLTTAVWCASGAPNPDGAALGRSAGSGGQYDVVSSASASGNVTPRGGDGTDVGPDARVCAAGDGGKAGESAVVNTISYPDVPAGSKGAAALIYDRAIPPITFAAGDIRVSLTKSGYTVTDVPLADIASVTQPMRVVVTTVDSPAGAAFAGAKPTTLTAQGCALRQDPATSHTGWWVLGADPIGAMYGGLEIAEAVRLVKGLIRLTEQDQNPTIARRGIKLNIPLDARTPSYSDAGTNAQLAIADVWDRNFWKAYFDTMARYRFNHINIWNMHPFPSMVNFADPALPTHFPNVGLSDVMKTTAPLKPNLRGVDMSTAATRASLTTLKKMTIAQKVQFWKEVMQDGADRGIEFWIITWNIFLYGTEDSGYPFTSANLTDATTTQYFREAVATLIKTYPLLRGIGFTTGENFPAGVEVTQKEAWIVATYVAGVNDAMAADPARKTKFEVLHRTQMTTFADIKKAMNTSGIAVPWSFEHKYSDSHMYVTTQPLGLRPNMGNITPANKVWLNCRDDDYYMFRFADPEFTRGYISHLARLSLEKVAGLFTGANYFWGRDTFALNPATPAQLYIQKRWMTFLPFARLAYDPKIPAQRFAELVQDRFPEVSGSQLLDAWASASKIFANVEQLSYVGMEDDFRFNPEVCLSASGFVGYQSFIQHAPQHGSGMIGVRSFAAGDTTGTSPLVVAQTIQDLADHALQITQTMTAAADPELVETIGDIESMALIGRYYAHKIRAAVNMAYATPKKAEAVQNLTEAVLAWRAYAARVSRLYKPQVMTRLFAAYGGTPADVTGNIQQSVNKELTDLGGALPP